MTVHLSFLQAVALAGAAFALGATLVHRSRALQAALVPEPLLGGLLAALALLALRLLGLRIEVPTSGRELDFLVALLTTNMGLHVTPKLVREAGGAFVLFAALAAALFVAQFLLVLPIVALTGDHAVRAAIVAAPLSLVGAPFNLNPPTQVTSTLADLLRPLAPEPTPLAQGVMMIGVLAGIVLPAVFLRRQLERRGIEAPGTTPEQESTKASVGRFAYQETVVVLLVLALIALAFTIERALLAALPWWRPDYLPVIAIAYLLGLAVRLAVGGTGLADRFPERALSAILVGPTMALVLTYAVLSVPLHRIGLVPPRLFLGALVGVAASAVAAWLAVRLFRRLLEPYYAVVIGTAFLAVTTAWGPIGMSYLRRSMRAEGKVEPMPVILPLNAFFIFPWMAYWLTRLAIRLFG